MRVNFSLKKKFFILLVLTLAWIGFLFYFVVEKEFVSYFENNTKNDFANHIQFHAPEYFDLSHPVSLKVGGKYDDYGKRIESISGVSNVRVLDPNGLVIYAQNPAEIGQNLIDSEGVKKSLSGDAALDSIDYTEKTARASAPIKSDGGEIRGVVTAKIDLAGATSFKDDFLLTVSLIMGGASIAFSVIAFWIFSNAEKEMDEQDRSTLDKSKALEEEQQLDEAIMSSIAESLIVINKDGQIMLYNPEAERITGHRSTDVEYRLYKKIIRFCDKEGKEVQKNPITEGLNSGERVTVNINEGLYVKSATNELIPISVSVAPITGKNETVRGVVATIQDITAEKELDKVKDEFVYIVVHELGNPIFALDGYLSILRDKCKGRDKQIKEIIESATGINQQLSSLVNDLLEMVKSESGQLKIDVNPIDLGKIFEAVIDSAKIKAKTKKITVNYIPEKTLNVMGDEQKIREVAINLIDNAIKYTPEGGKVEIWHEDKEGQITTFVKDNGMGISKESKKHLFEKFFRIKSETTKGISGTGLGLFICRQIVEKCGGRIWAESEEGEGSTFAFSLKKAK